MISKIYKEVLSSTFIKRFLLLFSASSISQLFLILSTPVLSRIYTPVEFGVFSLYMAIIILVSSFVALKFELAIMIPEKDDEAFDVFILGTGFVISFTLLIFLLMPFLYNIEYFNSIMKVSFISIILPLNIFSVGFYPLLTNWFIRKNRYALISKTKIIQTSTTIIISILLGIYFKYNGLIVGWFIGNFTYIFILMIKLFGSGIQKEYGFKFKELKKTFIRYNNFAKYTSPLAIISAFQMYLPEFLIPVFFSESVLGYYSMAARLVQAPLSLISKSINQVFSKTISEYYLIKKDIIPLIKKFLKINTLSLILPLIIVLFFSEEIFSIIFGAEWNISGKYLPYLIILFITNYLASSLSYIPSFFEKQKKALWLGIILAILKLIALYTGGLIDDIYLTFSLLSIFGASLYIYNIIWYTDIVKKKQNMI